MESISPLSERLVVEPQVSSLGVPKRRESVCYSGPYCIYVSTSLAVRVVSAIGTEGTGKKAEARGWEESALMNPSVFAAARDPVAALALYN